MKLNKLFECYNKIYIFGAQSRAKTLTGYLALLYPDVSVEAYLVDDLSGNDRLIRGVPVRKLDAGARLDVSLPVFIATKGVYHNGIAAKLTEIGFKDIIPVNVEVDNMLRNAYVRTAFARENRPFVKLEELCSKDGGLHLGDNLSARIYMAKSVYDNPLQTSYNCPDYETPIQVGAALTDERLEDGILTDCVGDNISSKNRQYCELTALYWIWRHAPEDMVGLSHYRRHFILPDDWTDLISSNDIDVVLPVPTYVYPNISENYTERHDGSDWDFLMEYLKENCPEYYGQAMDVYEGNLYSPCNMFIMQKGVLDGLCTWMFPILDAVVGHGGTKSDTYLNRYPGFISERLITLYFHVNREKYKIAYADRRFLL